MLTVADRPFLMSLDRGTKLFVLVWALAAVAFQSWLLRGWDFVWTAPAAFFVTFALGLFTRRAVVPVLVCAYLFPTIIRAAGSGFETEYAISWMAALLGILAADALRSPWQMPRPWRAPLILWALTITVGTAIAVWREIDYTPSLLLDGTISNSSIGGSPAFTAAWMVHVALTHVLGILWFDWLFGRTREEFERTVITPLVVSALVLASVSVYQMVVDVAFLNPTVFAAIHRAAGTMLDANVAGTIAALWVGGIEVWCERFGPRRWVIASAAAAVMWLAVWGSGSRTALAAALIVSVSMLAAGVKRSRRSQPRDRVIAVAALVACAFVAAVIFARRTDLTVSGPLQRLADMRTHSLTLLAGDLWRRDGYGTAANMMIGSSPWFGYGPGAFHLFMADFMPGLPPDNAQNWYRHQLVEFGVIGSLGWIAWVGGFAWFMVTRRRTPAAAWITGGALLAVGLISLLGVPAQDISVTITFWTFAFWYIATVTGEPSPDVASSSAVSASGAPPLKVSTNPGGLRPRAWAVIGVLVLGYAGGTIYLALTSLRVPMRAQHIGWPYSHGFYDAEREAPAGEYRWTRQRASAVVQAPRRWLALTVSVNHQDVEIRPVDARVWLDNRLVIDKRLSTTAPVTKYIRLKDDEARVVIDTWASRVLRPSDFGHADSRELGLMVSWNFSEQPPASADRASVERSPYP